MKTSLLALVFVLSACSQVARTTITRPLFGQTPRDNRLTIGGEPDSLDRWFTTAQGEPIAQATVTSLRRTEACVGLVLRQALDNDIWDVEVEVNGATTLADPFHLNHCSRASCIPHSLAGNITGGEICFPTGTGDVRQINLAVRKGALRLEFGWDFII